MSAHMSKKAIQYLRWSTLEQGQADRSSEDRQDANTKRMAALHGWTIVERHVDSGKSAFTGANLTTGKLGQLTKRFLTGSLDPADHVLVIEETDRLSRQPPGIMTAWLTPLLQIGLTVAVANTGQIIDKRVMETDFGGFVTMMSAAFSNYEFSRKQRERGNASWSKRRDAAAAGKNLSRHRARGWLRWDDAQKDYLVIEDRAWLVREMFRLRLAGWGKSAIAKTFNEKAAKDDRFKPWSTSKTPPKTWTPSAIARIVQDRGVTGYVQYHRNPRGAEKKVALGDPVKVYPSIIDDVTWAKANDARLTNQLKAQGRGRAVSNLLGPIAKCGSCDGTMQPLGSARWHHNKDGTKSQHYFLYCMTAKMTKGAGCDNQRGWPYRKIETPLIERLLTVAIDDQHFKAGDDILATLEGDVVRLQRAVTDRQASKRRLLAIIAGDDDEEAHEAYALANEALKAAKDDLAKAQEALGDAKGRVSPSEHIKRVSEVRSQLESEDEEERYEARTLVKAAFRNIIESITFMVTGFVVVRLVDNLLMVVLNADGQIVQDIDFVARGAEPGAGRLLTYRDGELVKVENDLNDDQQAAAHEYVRRRSEQIG